MTPTKVQIDPPVPISRIAMPIAAVGAIVLALATGFAAYYGALSAKAQQIADVKDDMIGRINVVSSDKDTKISATNVELASEKTRSDQFEKRLDRFENKIDVLLQRNGVNPAAAAMGTQ